jgi:uroporphyrinogen decarboxylase
MSADMSPLERVLAVIKGETPDYVPVFPMLNEWASQLLGMDEMAYYRAPQHLAEGQLALADRFQHDFLLAFTYLAREAECLGAPIHFEDGASPVIGGLIADSLEDVLALDIPDFESNPVTSVVLDQISKLASEAGSTYPILGVATGPFSWPTLVLGNDQWLTSLIISEPEEIQAVLAHSQRVASAWANAQLKAGAHAIALVDGSATKTVIPEDVFTEFEVPALTACTQAINGPIFLLGVGGTFESYMPHIAGTGVAGVVISTDDDIATCFEHAPNVIVTGNVNNLEFMDYTAADIDQLTQTCIAAGRGKRFIYGTQYVLSPMVAAEKIDAFVKAARTYGKY